LLLTLTAALFFAGHLVAVAAGDPQHAVLPLVRLLSGPNDLVLDAGCGAGRSTLALARLSDTLRVVALDRFDAPYIAGGGESLLRRNLELAGVSERVDIRRGDLLRLPFGDARFDCAASTHVLDHLGADAPLALRELARVLKPGGRLLVVLWVPSWSMFALSNVLCFAMAPPAVWLSLAEQAGLRALDEGRCNGMWFALLQKPHA
jgi:SAM-dependent methyltransferase